MSERQPSPIFVRTYDFLLWLIPRTLEFPRAHRGVMARRLQDAAFALHAALTDAAKGLDPPTALQRADAALSQLRTYLRLSYDLKLVSMGQYEHGARYLVEIGRLLGGWQQRLRAGRIHDPAGS